MPQYIVTVKLPKNPQHNPHNKVPGICPFNDRYCTDVTGEHHSKLFTADTAHAAKQHFLGLGLHVTRVETVGDDIA